MGDEFDDMFNEEDEMNDVNENDEENSDVDNEHPFGRDEGDEEEGEKEKSPEINKSQNSIFSKKKGTPNLKRMKSISSAYGFGEHKTGNRWKCPACKQESLFNDKIISTGLRAAVSLTFAAFGKLVVDKDLHIARYVCLNPACKHYWPNSGDKFMKGSTGTFVVVKNYKHIPK